MTEEMPQLVMIYARQVLSNKFDVDHHVLAYSSAREYVKSVEAIEMQ